MSSLSSSIPRLQHSKKRIRQRAVQLCTSNCKKVWLHRSCIYLKGITSCILLEAAEVEELQATIDRGYLALESCTAELQLPVFLFLGVLCDIANAPAAPGS